MNIPTTLPFALLCIVLLTACPTSDPAKDDTAEPADGGTGGASCEDEDAKIEAQAKVIAEQTAKIKALAECHAAAPK